MGGFSLWTRGRGGDCALKLKLEDLSPPIIFLFLFREILKSTMRYLFIIVLILSVYSKSVAQESSKAFFYETHFISDSLNPQKKGSDLMVLWSSDSYSVFQSYYGFQRDSLVKLSSSKEMNSLDLGTILASVNAVRKPSFKYIIHKNFIENNILVYENLFFDNYSYTQPKSELDWEIKRETKEILGFSCQKATLEYSGRTYIAWFTPEIPISDGPYVFNGLPGLIVDMEDSKGHYKFSLIALENRQEQLELLTLNNPISLPKKNFFKLKKDMYRDVSKALIGKQGSVSNQDLRSVQARYDKANNPLEKIIK